MFLYSNYVYFGISRVFGIDYWTFGPLYGFPWFLGS